MPAGQTRDRTSQEVQSVRISDPKPEVVEADVHRNRDRHLSKPVRIQAIQTLVWSLGASGVFRHSSRVSPFLRINSLNRAVKVQGLASTTYCRGSHSRLGNTVLEVEVGNFKN